jgi:hypothetical protein
MKQPRVFSTVVGDVTGIVALVIDEANLTSSVRTPSLCEEICPPFYSFSVLLANGVGY